MNIFLQVELISLNDLCFSDEYLLTVSAQDKDDSTVPNGMVLYRLDSGGEGKFTLDSNTGEFKTSGDAVFDYESQRIFTVSVSVKLSLFILNIGTS